MDGFQIIKHQNKYIMLMKNYNAAKMWIVSQEVNL